MRRFRLMLPLFLLLALAACSERDRPLESPVRFEGGIFGSFYQVTVVDPLTQGEANALEEGILAELEAVDAQMSLYREDSELADFNGAPLEAWQPLSDPLTEVLGIALGVAEASGGAFDVTVGGLVNLWSFGAEARPERVPDEEALAARLAHVGMDALELRPEAREARRLRDVTVDLGGVAKGYATDRVAAFLEAEGIEHFLVNLGGDLLARGYRDGEAEPWRIGIEAPLQDRREAQVVLPIHDISVATSGDYRNFFMEEGRRYSHTLDPRSGQPITHRLASVSVFHPANAWADAWATALTVLGEEAGMVLAEAQGLAVLMSVREREGWRTLASPAFVERFGEAPLDDRDANNATQE